ncbi:ImpA family type VI secretion system protein [Burkholderia pyrrocinia]|uniref:type VI secretion system protein TssA n=1 Tax=Burkholderia pyrrocinia TaxID=60550 RepID=UPI001FC898CB|nr:type VI secretion system ImpA family N-terminal domain-containing protein [Burkholderia pyrrocinia]
MTRTKRDALAIECPPAWQAWLAPIELERPCGPDLEYDRAFVLLMEQTMTKPDVQYGDFVEDPPSINWSIVERDCRQLMARTKDMRVALLFARCRARLGGVAGLADGLGLLGAWLRAFPQTLHPCVTEDNDDDAIRDIRRNVLQGLTDPEGLLADVRELVSRLVNLDVLQPDVLAAARQAARHLADIIAWAGAELDSHAPDLSALQILLLQALGSAEPQTRFTAEFSPKDWASVERSGSPDVDQAPLFDVMPEPNQRLDREAARELLRKVREWFEAKEPSSPITVLLKRGERCIGMSYVELAQTLPPDLVASWEKQDAAT